jgi:hypothetical protein
LASGACGSCPCPSGQLWGGGGCQPCPDSQWGRDGYTQFVTQGCYWYSNYQCCSGCWLYIFCSGCGCFDPCFGILGGCQVCWGSYCNLAVYQDCIISYSGYALPSYTSIASSCSN